MFTIGLCSVLFGIAMVCFGEAKKNAKAELCGYVVIVLSNIFIWYDVIELLIK